MFTKAVTQETWYSLKKIKRLVQKNNRIQWVFPSLRTFLHKETHYCKLPLIGFKSYTWRKLLQFYIHIILSSVNSLLVHTYTHFIFKTIVGQFIIMTSKICNPKQNQQTKTNKTGHSIRTKEMEQYKRRRSLVNQCVSLEHLLHSFPI